MGGISVATVFVSIIALTELSEAIKASEEFGTTGCERRLLRKKYVEQSDSRGLKCWGSIDVLSCIGHCESSEVNVHYLRLLNDINSDIESCENFLTHCQLPILLFPYKESRHHTCIDDGRKLEFVMLEYCDPGVEEVTQRYNYAAPIACKCAPCNPADNSCLSLKKRTMLSRTRSESSYPMKPESMPSTGFKNEKEWASNFPPSPQYQVYYV